jgi:hypothetical protein
LDQRKDTRKSGGHTLKGFFFTAVFISHNFINPSQYVADIFDADGSCLYTRLLRLLVALMV